ncbi:MAG TPA: FliM/FliN family flagellar motor switch protein [Bryobacteraceae bacterium]|nr:FliM/FliN family flagellar motor switch protein [Bryobacteraceae bacterium]
MKSIAERADSADTRLEAFNAIEDVPLRLRVELDKRNITFRSLLELGLGSIVVFPRPTGENVDLYAEDVLLGSGEILVIDSALAVRVADLRDKPISEPDGEDATARPQAATKADGP